MPAEPLTPDSTKVSAPLAEHTLLGKKKPKQSETTLHVN
jgi:hypothetical protein